MKNKFVLMFLPFFVLPLVVGGGFAVFFFGNDTTSSSQDINISITDNPELGSIQLVYQDNNEYKPELPIENSKLTTQLFMDFDRIYFIRSDNLTAKRDFIIEYTPPSDNGASIPDGYTISLSLDFIIEDTDARGYKANSFVNSKGETMSYPSSDSIIDFFEPTYVTYHELGKNIKFNYTSGTDTSTSVTYSCLIQEDITSKEEEYAHFTIEMAYKDYTFGQNGEIFEGSMAPNASIDKVEYEKRIESNNKSKLNSNITIAFSLSLLATDGE